MISKLSYYFIPLLFVISLVLFFHGITFSNYNDSNLIIWFKGFVSRMVETKIELFQIPQIDVVAVATFANNGLAIQIILRVVIAILYFLNQLIILLNVVINAVALLLNILKFAFMLVLEFQQYAMSFD